ncbi:MAG: HAD family hydrolase [Planctomycetia bacterium]
MSHSLAEYADLLDQRRLIWPRVPASISVAATPSIKPFPGIRAVLWDVYGTLLRITEGKYSILPAEELRLQIALDKTIHEFNMWNHMYRKPGPPWQSMIGIYRSTIERLQMRAASRGDVTEVSRVEVWGAQIEKLFEKEYVIDEDQYGDADEFAEKVAYFFHCCLQAVEAREGAVRAMTSLSGQGILQGCLSDGQSFTLVQLLRALSFQGELPPLFEVFRRNSLVFSYAAGVRKPSKSLFIQAVENLKLEGIAPEQVLHVSCRLMTDLVPAKAAGMKTALLVAEKSGLEYSSDVLKAPATRPDRLLTELSQITSIVVPT